MQPGGPHRDAARPGDGPTGGSRGTGDQGRGPQIASRFSKDWKAVVVLTGAEIFISGDGLYVKKAGSDGLGTAGSGDALAGVIGGLLARGADSTRAAIWGIHLHALAGETAADRLGDDGMIASDVVDDLSQAMRDVGAE